MKNLRTVYVFLLVALTSLSGYTQSPRRTENVVLVTLDGLRWQEVFGGADLRLLMDKKFVKDTIRAREAFWRTKSEERREVLMPFVWSVIAKQGQLYGNRALGSNVNTTNKMWFSYPGYNEILSGKADDERINSNNAVDNPNQTVLELLHEKREFRGRVAAFTSWETFPAIINTKRSGIPVNAGLMKVEKTPNDREQMLNDLLLRLPNESGATRLDGFTFYYAMEYLKRSMPRVLFISFDETDHFAHKGDYDRYLTAAQYTDNFIRQLWEWIQSQPQYRDKTTLLITTDHGRGYANPEDWRHHGSKIPNADEIWIAAIGPDIRPLGEATKGQYYQNQLAATVADVLGYPLNLEGAGESINTIVNKK